MTEYVSKGMQDAAARVNQLKEAYEARFEETVTAKKNLGVVSTPETWRPFEEAGKRLTDAKTALEAAEAAMRDVARTEGLVADGIAVDVPALVDGAL